MFSSLVVFVIFGKRAFQQSSGNKKAHKHTLFAPVSFGTALALSHWQTLDKPVCPWDKPRFSPHFTQWKPSSSRDKPSWSLGQTRGRRVAKKVYVVKVPFSLAEIIKKCNRKMTLCGLGQIDKRWYGFLWQISFLWLTGYFWLWLCSSGISSSGIFFSAIVVELGVFELLCVNRCLVSSCLLTDPSIWGCHVGLCVDH